MSNLKNMHSKLQDYAKQHFDLIDFIASLRVLDPRNVSGMGAPWSKYEPLFGLKIDDDDDVDLPTRKQEKNGLLCEAWARYTRIEKVTVSCAMCC